MTKHQDTRDIRREYQLNTLSFDQLSSDPLQQFGHWMHDVVDAGITDATAMTLATCNRDGIPSARIVLLKHHDENGFCWYTNFASHKGQDLAQNPVASLLFYWHALDRQVRITGAVSKLPDELADQYFHSRPRESQIGAIASAQSAPLNDRQQLKTAVEDLQQRYADDSEVIPRPDFWGGYRLQPTQFEFWQGREDRLHDRFIYQQEAGQWNIQRLAP